MPDVAGVEHTFAARVDFAAFNFKSTQPLRHVEIGIEEIVIDAWPNALCVILVLLTDSHGGKGDDTQHNDRKSYERMDTHGSLLQAI
jgi:hypothetical protein